MLPPPPPHPQPQKKEKTEKVTEIYNLETQTNQLSQNNKRSLQHQTAISPQHHKSGAKQKRQVITNITGKLRPGTYIYKSKQWILDQSKQKQTKWEIDNRLNTTPAIAKKKNIIDEGGEFRIKGKT